MASKLKQLDFSIENKKYKALNEKKEINFGKCSHSEVKFQNDLLVCPCGSAWGGPRLQELFDLFTKKK